MMHVHHASEFGGKSKHPFISAMTSTSLRLLISAIGLLIALFVDSINIYATFIGLIVIKLVIFVLSIFKDRKNEKKVGGEIK